MLELSFEKEVVKTLTTGSNQWVERKDLYGATPDQLWANFRDKLNNNNYAKLQGHPLTDTEFNQVKRAIEVRTPYEAAKLLAAENGIGKVEVERDDARLGTVTLELFWKADVAGGKSSYGVLPPKSKADFAFLLHGFYHLQEHGTMGIVLPHGVLFRGAKEGKIRQKLLLDNRIDAVIGLPANIFHSTGIPTLIMVLKKHKTTDDVLFIDASREFEKDKNQNKLTAANIQKIVTTYQNRQDVDKYAHVASPVEISQNEQTFNELASQLVTTQVNDQSKPEAHNER